MKKRNIALIINILLSITSCKKTYTPADFELQMERNEFRVINFADTQMDSTEDFMDNKTVYEIVKHAIEVDKPDMITFSGDNAWGEATLDIYKVILARMDEFKLPYFFVYGNHDREHALAEDIGNLINSSKYGHIKEGYNNDGLYGNYTIDIKKKNKPVHRFIMMDSVGNQYENIEEVKENRFNWYKSVINKIPCNSTIIMHIPFIEFFIVCDMYQTAERNNNQEEIEKLAPVGLCRKKENVSTSKINEDFFSVINEAKNTKNVICGHNHDNDFSLLLDGIRLTYSVKTGPESYMYDETMCGYTLFTIYDNKETRTEQKYYYVAGE